MIINNIPNKESKVTINTNLLTNWYFANPVNRRGGFCFVPKGTPCYMDTGLTPTDDRTNDIYPVEVINQTYSKFVSSGGNTWYVSTADIKHGYHKTGATIDRWYTNAGSLTVSIGDNSVDLTSIYKWHTFYQPIKETEQYRGQTMTASLYVDSIDKESSFQFGLRTVSESALNNSILLSNSGVYSITWTIPDDATELQFFIQSMIDSAGTISIKAVKLELGDAQTLAYQDSDGSWKLYEIPSYEEELAKCKAIEPEVNNPNLLHNWYFANPVNRKNGYYLPVGSNYYTVAYSEEAAGTTTVANQVAPFSSSNTQTTFVDSSGTTMFCDNSDCKKGYVGLTTYPWSIDRWIARGSLVTVLDDGVQVSTGSQDINNAGFQTTVEDPQLLVGKKVTLSFLVTENNATSNIVFGIFYGAGAVNMTSWAISYVSIPAGATGLFSITGTLPDMGDYKAMNPSIRMQGTQNGDFTLLAAKLEVGNAQTLAHQDENGEWVLNEIPDYQEMYEQCSIYPIEAEQSYISSGGFIPASGNVTMTGKLVAHSDTTYNAYRVRNVKLTSSNVTAGTTALENGSILLKYV